MTTPVLPLLPTGGRRRCCYRRFVRSAAPVAAAFSSLAIFPAASDAFAPMQNAPAAAAAPAAKQNEKKADSKKPAKPPQEDPEIKMGRETHEDLIKSGIRLIGDPAVVSRVETIGKKLAAIANVTPMEALYGSSELVPYEYRFFVVDDPDINAFSLPGGYIYINKGLLNYVQSDDELAGVLGHEIMHAAHHHVMKLQREQNKLSSQLTVGLLAAILAKVPSSDVMNLMTGFQLIAVQKVSGFGQTAERDADQTGVVIAQKAGYNPVGALTFMERLARDEKSRPEIEYGIFRTHPPSRERASAMIAQIREMGLPINRRDVTNTMKVAVREAKAAAAAAPAPAAGATEVTLDDKVLFRTASPERAKQAADTLNRLLQAELQIYDITRRGSVLLARGETIVTIEPGDAALHGSGASAESVADQAYRMLRNALYKQFLDTAY